MRATDAGLVLGAPDELAIRTGARRINAIATALWLAGLLAYTATVGLPTKRMPVVLWTVLAVLALEAARPRHAVRSLLLAWGPVILALMCYDRLRGMSDDLMMSAHLGPHLDFDRWLFAGTVPSVQLQAWLYERGAPSWYDYVAWTTYTSHFLLPLGIGVALWKLHSRRFAPYIGGLLILSFMALGTYAGYPAEPPWMAARDGHIGEVHRVVHAMWNNVGIEKAAGAFATAAGTEGRYSNPVAALPSLHAAFPVLILLALRGVRRWLSWVLGGYAFLMGLTLVYGGEHYVFDVFMGWAYAWAAWLAASHLMARHRLRRLRAATAG